MCAPVGQYVALGCFLLVKMKSCHSFGSFHENDQQNLSSLIWDFAQFLLSRNNLNLLSCMLDKEGKLLNFMFILLSLVFQRTAIYIDSGG